MPIATTPPSYDKAPTPGISSAAATLDFTPNFYLSLRSSITTACTAIRL